MSDSVKALGIGLLILIGSHAYQTGALKDFQLPIKTVSVGGEVGELGKLVTDDKSRQMLAGLYRELADALESDAAGVIGTTEQFRNGYKASSVLLVQGTEYKPAGDVFDSAASARIEASIGLKAVALTPEMKAKLVATLREMSKELGG